MAVKKSKRQEKIAKRKKEAVDARADKPQSAKAVLAMMKSLDKDMGGKAIALKKKKASDFCSTGIYSLDLIMGGGYYGGQVFQFFGQEHSGKCVTKQTLVSTDEGLCSIGEVFQKANHPAVCAQQEVEFSLPLTNRYGGQEKCSRLFMNGRRQVWKIRTASGGQIECTSNHPHLVMSESGNWVWRATREIRAGDSMLRVPSMPFGSLHEDDDVAYLAGVLTADGCMNGSRVLISNDDPDIQAVIESGGPCAFGVDQKTYDKNSTSVQFSFSTKEEVAAFYEKWGTEAEVAALKRVPNRVRSFDRAGVTAFLRGYFDCESFTCSTGIEVSSANEELLQDVQLLLQQFGIFGTIQPKTSTNYADNSRWRLTLSGRDLRQFMEDIGARSSKVQSMYDHAKEETMWEKNTDKHSIPHVGQMLRDLYESCGETDREHNTIFDDTVNPAGGRTDKYLLSYDRLRQILDLTKKGAWDKSIRNRLQEIFDCRYFYDPVESIEDVGEQPVFDIKMPETHSFVANGFVTHNSTLGYSSAAWATSIAGIPTAFFDHETTTDRAYTEKLGMDYDLVNYFRPETGEWTYDWIDEFCSALPDKHSGKPQAIMFIDTIKAMKPRRWLEDPDNRQQAAEASMHSRGWGRIQTLIGNKHVPIVAANQVRTSAGDMYAAREVVPGGKAWSYATANLIRVGRPSGKPNIELPTGPVLQPVLFKTYKNKNFIPMQECTVYLELGEGWDIASDVLEFAKLVGCYFKVKGDKIVQKGGTPMIKGLGEAVDGKYKSSPALEAQIRSEGREGPFAQRCQELLNSGEAMTMYLATRREDESDDGDQSLLDVRRKKQNASSDDDGDGDEAEEDEGVGMGDLDEEPDVVTSAPEEEVTQPAPLGKKKETKKSITKKKKTAAKKSSAAS